MTLAYAATDDFHQALTAGRHPSPVDVGIDSLGVLLCLLALMLWLRSWRARSSAARLAGARAQTGAGARRPARGWDEDCLAGFETSSLHETLELRNR
jgi:hypothetical protein